MAEPTDVPRMIALAAEKRAEYEQYQPVFWRRVADAAEKQAPYFAELLRSPQHIVLVHDVQGQIDGFVIAAIVAAPPVYDPGGLMCVLDDFTVAEPGQWPTLGRALLDEVIRRVKERDVVQIVVVCGQRDAAKRSMLEDAGLPVASEWRTRSI